MSWSYDRLFFKEILVVQKVYCLQLKTGFCLRAKRILVYEINKLEPPLRHQMSHTFACAPVV